MPIPEPFKPFEPPNKPDWWDPEDYDEEEEQNLNMVSTKTLYG